MNVEHVEFLVEERSTEETLRILLPKLLGDQVTYDVYSYNGKCDMLRKIEKRLRGYSKWLPATHRIVVLVDRDDEDCHDLKGRLDSFAVAAGLNPSNKDCRSQARRVIIRIAVEELEAWFFGDPGALRMAFPGISDTLEFSKGYRDPDAIRGGTWEALERILKRSGYFKGGYRKLEVARTVARHMDPDRNRSKSFRVFRDAVTALRSSK